MLLLLLLHGLLPSEQSSSAHSVIIYKCIQAYTIINKMPGHKVYSTGIYKVYKDIGMRAGYQDLGMHFRYTIEQSPSHGVLT